MSETQDRKLLALVTTANECRKRANVLAARVYEILQPWAGKRVLDRKWKSLHTRIQDEFESENLEEEVTFPEGAVLNSVDCEYSTYSVHYRKQPDAVRFYVRCHWNAKREGWRTPVYGQTNVRLGVIHNGILVSLTALPLFKTDYTYSDLRDIYWPVADAILEGAAVKCDD